MRTATVHFIAGLSIALFALHLAAATRTWTGTNSGSWSDAGNWTGSGDDLVFPAGALNQVSTNDLPALTPINSITITGGAYTLSGNAIELGAGGLTVSSSGNTINLPIVLGVAQTWTAAGTADVTIAGVLSGTGAITKSGTGAITFAGNNTYSGLTTINQGYLIVSSSNALGTAASGTIVNAGGSLSLLDVVLGNEAISATGQGQSGSGALQNASCGDGTFTGPITVSGSVKFSACGTGGSLSFNGPIGGTVANLHLSGTSPFFFNAVNTLSGPFYIDQSASPSTVNIGIDNAFSDVVIDIGVNETLKLNDFSDRITALSGHGTLDLGSGTLTITGTNFMEYGGVISGTGKLIAAGDAAQVFTIINSKSTATGTLGNSGPGKLVVRLTTWPGSVLLTGGRTVFGSQAVMGPVTVNPGATILFDVFSTTSGDLTMAAGSTLAVWVFDSIASTHHTLNGTANLGGAAIQLSDPGESPGARFTIIDNDGSDPVIGTFANAPEGATIMSASGQPHTITYKGGDGNDVVLTALRFPTTTTLFVGPNPAIERAVVSCAAKVTSRPGSHLTGTVTFFDGPNPFATVSMRDDNADFGTEWFLPGTHSITATYNGDAMHASSSSAPIVLIVEAPPPPALPVPALDPRALLMLAIVLAIGGALLLRR